MKTAYEFRKKALDFASKDDMQYDAVCCKGIYKDFEVYSPYKKEWKDNPPCIGLPELILVNENEIEWAFSKRLSPFEILDGCKKLPKVYFEYDRLNWYADSYTVQLFSDGTLLKTEKAYSKLMDSDLLDKNKERIVAVDKYLLKEIKAVIKDNEVLLKRLPKDLSDYEVIDGPNEKIKFGSFRFHGSNIFMRNSISDFFGSEVPSDIKEFNILFKKIRDKIDEKVSDGTLWPGFEEKE